MSAIKPEREISKSAKVADSRSWLEGSATQSAAAMLMELGLMFAAAEAKPPSQGLCSRCRSYRDPRTSTAQSPNVFCSEQCEKEFIREALASVTLEDCIRIQQRLEELVTSARGAAV